MPNCDDKAPVASAPAGEPAPAERAAANTGGEPRYAVGYKKPPKATQFKKGQSGNPRGRRKAASVEDIRTVIEDVLAQEVPARIGGRDRSISKLEATLRRQVAQALAGKRKAVLWLFKQAQKAGLFTRLTPIHKGIILVEPSGDEGRIVRAFHAERGRQAVSSQQAGASPARSPIAPPADRASPPHSPIAPQADRASPPHSPIAPSSGH
jgi:hypothetical protein